MEGSSSSRSSWPPGAVGPAGTPNGELPADFGEAPTRIHQHDADHPHPMPAEPLADIAGAQLGIYELLDCIGVGGMGRVFRARDTVLDRIVALKILNPAQSGDPEIARRFEQEAKAAAKLNDPHFARVYGFGIERNLQYIAMEYVEGENLRQLMGDARLEHPRVLHLAMQLAEGLHHADEVGVVHRDIKPSNIIVTPKGIAKLVDLGLARSSIRQDGTELTQAGVTLGTFDYISPEQAYDPRTADSRSDIYSLGCTLFHLLTGMPPFPDGTGIQKVLMHQQQEIPDPRSLVTDLPESFAQAIMRMMAKSPHDRQQSPAELLADLQQVAEDLGTELPPLNMRVERIGPRYSFWDRQLTWLLPLVLFLGVITVLTYYDHSSPGVTLPDYPLALLPSPDGKSTAKTVSETKTNEASAPGDKAIEVAEGADLAEAIRQAPVNAILLLRGAEYRLPRSADGRPGLTISKRIRLQGGATRDLTRIILEGPRPDDAAPALAVERAKVAVERLHFVVGDIPTGRRAIALRNSEWESTGCHYDVDGPVDRADAELFHFVGKDACRLLMTDSSVLLRCALAEFDDAGQHTIRLINTGFECPTLLRVGRHDESLLWLEQITVRAGSGPIIAMEEFGQTGMTVNRCVFAREAGVGPLLAVAQPTGRLDFVQWSGQGNLYYGLDGQLLQVAGRQRWNDWKELAGMGFRDELSESLLPDDESLWTTERRSDGSSRPTDRFQLARRWLSARGSRQGMIVGLRTGPWGPLYPELKSLGEPTEVIDAPAVAAPSRILRVDPQATPGEEKGVYTSLQAACREAPSGYVIELRGPLVTEQEIVIANKELSIRSAPGARSELRFVVGDVNHRLFRLPQSGKVRIDGVDIRIDGETLSAKSMFPTLFEASRGAKVSLENVTIDRADEDFDGEAVVFSLFAPDMGMAGPKEPGPEAAALQLLRCRINLKGSLLNVDPTSEWLATLADSFVALSGALASVHGRTAVGEKGANSLIIEECTLCLGDALVRLGLEGTQPEAPAALMMDVSRSVVLEMGEHPLLQLVGDLSPSVQQNAIYWQGSDNFLAGFTWYWAGGRKELDPADNGWLGKEAWLKRWNLDVDRYYFGDARLPVEMRGVIWEQSVPLADELHKIGMPENRRLGVDPMVLPAP